MVGVLLGDDEGPALPGITLLPSVRGAVAALGHATQYAEWRRRPREPKPLANYSRAAAAP